MSRRRPRTGGTPEEVDFPVTPMLDMAFQLLAFFVLTFQVPTRETRLDLYLPAAPAALPKAEGTGGGRGSRGTGDLENDLVVRAEADPAGGLKSLKLGESPLSNAIALRAKLDQYAALLSGKPLRVVLVADENLLYGEAADLVGACTAAGVSSLRLAPP